MSSDLISKGEVESVLHNNLHALIDTDQLYQLYKDINRLPTRAEVQAYFDGQAYGWEEGIKALIDDVKAEIDKAQEPYKTSTAYDEGVRFGLMLAYQIIDKYKAESEDI